MSWLKPNKPQWIVTVNRPYYPSVEYFDTEEEAYARADEAYTEDGGPHGEHTVKVTVAKELSTKVMFTHY